MAFCTLSKIPQMLARSSIRALIQFVKARKETAIVSSELNMLPSESRRWQMLALGVCKADALPEYKIVIVVISQRGLC